VDQSQSGKRAPAENGVPSSNQRKQQGLRWDMQDEQTPTDASRPQTHAADGESQQIAERAAATWHRIDSALAPIIGHGGVAALYRRSLFLTRALSPWLPGVHQGALDPVEFAELQAAVALQSDTDALAATEALTRTFQDLLTELIGSSLTERLLRDPSAPTSHGAAVQDTLP
jgi:hypothetical protein